MSDEISNKPWTGNAADYDDAADWCNACLIDENPAGQPKIKGLCKLPVYEVSPNDPKGGPKGDNPQHEVGALNVNAVHAAAAALAGGRGGVQASPASKKKAARKLLTLYARIKQPAPPSIKQMAM